MSSHLVWYAYLVLYVSYKCTHAVGFNKISSIVFNRTTTCIPTYQWTHPLRKLLCHPLLPLNWCFSKSTLEQLTATWFSAKTYMNHSCWKVKGQKVNMALLQDHCTCDFQYRWMDSSLNCDCLQLQYGMLDKTGVKLQSFENLREVKWTNVATVVTFKHLYVQRLAFRNV